MEENELDKIVDAWIAAENAGRETQIYADNWWAIERALDWQYEERPDLLWRFILQTYKREMSERAFAVLAAGPVEDLLVKFGEDYIDRIQELAERDDKFNLLLGGVWRRSMREDIWKRVQQARNTVW